MDFTVAGDFDREPQLDQYAGLVKILAAISHRALLITRHYHVLEPTEALLRRLGPSCIVREERSQWPNTRLHPPNTEIIHEFRLSSEVVLALSESVNRLYGWGGPLPEDLGFIREDGSVVLYSTTHEEEAGLCLSSAEKELLEGACPWLADYVTWRVPTEAERRIRKAGG
jgi:hypothetical protein